MSSAPAFPSLQRELPRRSRSVEVEELAKTKSPLLLIPLPLMWYWLVALQVPQALVEALMAVSESSVAALLEALESLVAALLEALGSKEHTLSERPQAHA